MAARDRGRVNAPSSSKRKLVVETIKEISHLVIMEVSLLKTMVTVVICAGYAENPLVLTTKEETIILTDTPFSL